MKRYTVTVNGVSYDVEVEEAGAGAPASSPAPAAAPQAAKPQTASAAKATVQAESGTIVRAPMPGTILKMHLKVGDTVKKDDLVCILEAMKMENEIFAPAGGKVIAVHAPAGTSVNTGDPIVALG